MPHVPFRRAAEFNGQNLAEHFPEVDKLKGPKRVAFDVEKIFFATIPGHYADIVELHARFPFVRASLTEARDHEPNSFRA